MSYELRILILNSNRLLEKSHQTETVMLNLFQHLQNQVLIQTLNQVQGDKRDFFHQPDRLFILNSSFLIYPLSLFPNFVILVER